MQFNGPPNQIKHLKQLLNLQFTDKEWDIPDVCVYSGKLLNCSSVSVETNAALKHYYVCSLVCFVDYIKHAQLKRIMPIYSESIQILVCLSTLQYLNCHLNKMKQESLRIIQKLSIFYHIYSFSWTSVLKFFNCT